MGMSKELSRREFLQGLGLSIPLGLSLAVGYQLSKLYPFLPYFLNPDHGPVSPENFESLIDVEVTSLFSIKENGQGRIFEVSFDKKAAAEALYLAAETMMPREGPSKLFEILMVKPLRISIHPDKSVRGVIRGAATETYGDELRYLFANGPGINYYRDLLLRYREAVAEENPVKQERADRKVIHEFVHLVQDIRNPFDSLPQDARFLVEKAVSQFGLVREPNHMELDYEQEAVIVANQVVQRIYRQYVEGLPNSSWPFGHFFKFTEV